MFTAFQWLLIDLATAYGLDKKTFEERISFSREIVDSFRVEKITELFAVLKPWADTADEPVAFKAAALAIWDCYNGTHVHHFVGQDAAASGAQLMSVMLRDTVGMTNTGVLGNEVPDLYTTVHKKMNIPTIDRKTLKKGMIPHMYLSTAAPRAVFGENYETFVDAYTETVPSAQAFGTLMVRSWDEEALEYHWELPDGFHVRMPVLKTTETAIPYLDHKYTFRHTVIAPKSRKEEGTKALAANTIHSLDGFVLRELVRRCNHNPVQLDHALDALKSPECGKVSKEMVLKLKHIESLATKFNFVSLEAVEYITPSTAYCIPPEYRAQLIELIERTLEHKPFEVMTIHDDFRALPSNVNRMKETYNHILYELYHSTWGYEIIKQFYGPINHAPIDPVIAAQIKHSKYAIN